MASSSLVIGASFLPLKNIPDSCKSLSILVTNNCGSPVKVRKLAINHHPFGFRLSKNSLSASPCRPIVLNCSSSLPMLSGDVVPSPPTVVLPWLMLPQERSSVYKFYRLAERDVKEVMVEKNPPDANSRFLGSSSFQGPWVAYLQSKDCQLVLFNPLSGKKINLPSIETLPTVRAVIRYQSGFVESFIDYMHYYPVSPENFSKYIVEKVVLSSSPMDDDCIAVVPTYSQLAFCRVGDSNDANCWVALDSPISLSDQIVFHSEKKLFFTFSCRKELQAWDLHNDPIKRFPIHIQKEDWGGNSWPSLVVDKDELDTRLCYCWDHDYLVYDHQSQELFIVTRYTAANIDRDGNLISTDDEIHDQDQFPYKTLSFDVFKVEFINDDHVELQPLKDNIGNRAFFIGSNPGFALSTSAFSELRPNSIYFTDDHSERKLYWGGYDLGIYDYEERSISSCYYPIDLYKTHRISPAPIWFTPESGC